MAKLGMLEFFLQSNSQLSFIDNVMQQNKQTPSLNQTEKEIITLKSVFDLIDDLVNYNMVSLNHKDPDSQILFKSDVHQKYFYIKLMDFLSDSHKIWGVKKIFIGALQDICNQPQLNSHIDQLKQETEFSKMYY